MNDQQAKRPPEETNVSEEGAAATGLGKMQAQRKVEQGKPEKNEEVARVIPDAEDENKNARPS